MATDKDVDRLLRDAAERWRSGVAVDRDVEARDFLRAEGTRVSWIVSASLGVIVTAAVFGVLVLSGSFPDGESAGAPAATTGATQATADQTPGTSQGTMDPKSLIVEIGDTVVATGAIGARGTGEVYLCPGEFTLRGDALGCRGGRLVQVLGVDGMAWSGRSATVRGTWTGELVQVDEISAAEPTQPAALGPVPCDPPVGGWPGNQPSDAAEAAGQALEREVQERPDDYVGIWAAVLTDVSGRDTGRVVVVGSVDDVDVARDHLSQLYPFNLCVVPVEFSARELESVAQQVAAFDSGWRIEVEPRLDRVVVTATALDAAGYAQLAPLLDKVALQTTVRHPDQ